MATAQDYDISCDNLERAKTVCARLQCELEGLAADVDAARLTLTDPNERCARRLWAAEVLLGFELETRQLMLDAWRRSVTAARVLRAF